jgi:hypothetical protein
VSCVVSAVRRPATTLRRANAAWNPGTSSANRDGSPPTSVSELSRVPVERTILDALRHDGPVVCMKRRDSSASASATSAARRGRRRGRAARGCRGHGIRQQLAAGRKVRAVDGEGGEQLGERVAGTVVAEVGAHGVGQAADETTDLGRLRGVGDLALRAGDHVVPVHGPAAQALVERGQRRRAGRVDEHPVDLAERVVARGPVGRPPAGQLFARLEDLLDETGKAGSTRRRVATAAERVEVAARVGEAVGVVDAQTVDEPSRTQRRISTCDAANTSGARRARPRARSR